MNSSYGDRDVWRIAAPMIISSATTPLLGFVDTAVVGHLQQPYYLGAVGTGATLFSVLFMGLNFLRMGTTGITAQACGAGLGSELREALGRGLLTALVLAVLIIAMRPGIIAAALWLFAPSTEVAIYTRQYFDVRVLSAPAALCNYVIIGWLLGMQNARGPLAIALVTNLANVILDLVFVLLLGMAVRGVALASLISEFLGLATGLLFVRAELGDISGRWQIRALFDAASYRHLFAINGNLLLRTLALMFVFGFVTAQGARAGDVILAANALLMNFQFFLSYVLDGIANAAEALVGRAIGARDRDGMLHAVRRTLSWSLTLALGFCAVYLVGGNAIVGLLTSIPEVQSAAHQYLPWLALSPAISVWSFLYDGVYVGATRPREMRVVMVGAALLVFLPVWYIARPLGNHGLWLAFTLFMLARGLGMHLWFRAMISRGALAAGQPRWA